jgi:methylglyoxal synthase
MIIFLSVIIPLLAMKTLALVAHDSTKSELLAWAQTKKEYLLSYKLVATAHTAELLQKNLKLEIESIGHGPDGGDILLAARILQAQIDGLVFFIDARTPHGHEHDIQTLIRICVIRNIPIALNHATADLLIGQFASI